MPRKTTAAEDGSLWRWSVVTTPILATAGLFALGALIDQLRLSLWFVVPVAVCGVIGTIIAAHKADLGRFASWYAVLVVLGSGTWLAWVAAFTPWSSLAVTVLLCGLVALGPLWFLARHTQHRKRLRDLEEERRQRIAAEAQKWPDILAGLGMPGVVLLERVKHGEGSYSLHLRLPVNGRVRFGVLKSRTEELEIAAGLRYGALNVERGDTAADVWLHVNEIDVLAQTIPLPRDNTPLTINRPLPLGLYEDGTVLEVPMQGRASKTVGLRGKGKSNLINVKLAALTRCVDVVIWVMDNKGGRTARPWLLPWLDGRTDRPVLDWVATTRAENTRMLKAAVAVIEYRANSGIGGDKIIPTARMPELMLICEEVALILGQHDVANYGNAKLGLTIVQLGRAEAVSVDLVAQRGTVTMLGSGDLKSQLENTFGLGVADANDARYTFGDSHIAADLAKLEHPGSLLVRAGEGHAHRSRQGMVGRARRDRRTRRRRRTEHLHPPRSRRRLGCRGRRGRGVPQQMERRTSGTPPIGHVIPASNSHPAAQADRKDYLVDGQQARLAAVDTRPLSTTPRRVTRRRCTGRATCSAYPGGGPRRVQVREV